MEKAKATAGGVFWLNGRIRSFPLISHVRFRLQNHALQFLGGHAQRLLFSLDQHNASLGDLLFEPDPAYGAVLPKKILRDKTNAQIRLYHGQDLIGGKGLDVRLIGQAVAGENFRIEFEGFRIRSQRDQRVVQQLLQTGRLVSAEKQEEQTATSRIVFTLVSTSEAE